MTKKISIVFIVTLSALFLFSACSTTKVEENEKPKKEIVPPTKGLVECENYQEAGKLMIDSVIEGVSSNNYELYSRDFTEKNKKYFNINVFKQAAAAVKKELGEFESKTYVGFWVKGAYTILLWKARYTKTKDDILLEMYITKTKEGSYMIAAYKYIQLKSAQKNIFTK